MAMAPTMGRAAFTEQFPDIAALTSRAAVLNEMKRLHDAEMNNNSVTNLLRVGAMTEWAVSEKMFPSRSLQQFITSNTPYTYSYVALARRWHRDRDNIEPAIEWYKAQDANRALTGFKFRTAQASGVVFVRDVLKAYQTAGYPKRNGDANAPIPAGDLTAVDDRYPMRRVPRKVMEMPFEPNAMQSRSRLEAIIVHCVVRLAQEQIDDPIVSQWRNLDHFREWVTNGDYTSEQDAAVEFIGDPPAWKSWAELNIPYPVEMFVSADLDYETTIIPLRTVDEMTDEAMHQQGIYDVMREHGFDAGPMRAYIARIFANGGWRQARDAAIGVEGAKPTEWAGIFDQVRAVTDMIKNVHELVVNEDAASLAAIRQIAADSAAMRGEPLPLDQRVAQQQERFNAWLATQVEPDEVEERAAAMGEVINLYARHREITEQAEEDKSASA